MNPTLSIAEVERILRMARAASLERSAPKSSPIVPVERGGRLALSFAQQRLWFLEQLGELGSTYHIPRQLRLRGALDRAALARALERIVARHESLRTVFVQVDGEPEQRILPVEESGFGLVEHDLRGEPHAEAEVERLVAREADAPFDLERGPLVRACLVRLADDDHLLLLTMHHVVSDAWSMGVFTRELSTLYTAFSQGRPDPLPALPVQYADYAAWQRRWVEGEVLEAQAAYWTRTLAGAPELLELPTDHARPARQDHAGATLHVELGRELTAGLTVLSHRHGTTLYMTLLAGWATVLARLSGQDDVVVGTPSANRARPEVEELIGFFVNTLALRVDLSGSPTVSDLLAQVKARALEGQRNQDIPFEQVVERLRPARSLAYSPLFQVMFAWEDAAGGALELPGLQLAPAASAPQVTAKFDLLLSLGEAGGELVGAVEYATSLFERSTVERWVGYLRAVLEGMAADDGRSVDRIPILPEAERRQVLREWNATDAPYPREACIHELFEAQVERTPGAEAVSFEGERLTYAELNARANRLAHHLRSLGVGPDARVGICVERSVEMVVGLLGILKAGGAYVPLDASYPVDRLRNMLEDSAPAVLLTHPPQAATAAALSAASAIPVLDLTSDGGWADQPETNPAREGLGPRNLAHVLFTSGSTGRPKGVMLEHGSLVNRLAWMQDRYGMEPGEAMLQKTPFSFDVSFWEFFWPLMVGARLVMARPDGHRDPAYLVETIHREGITTAHFVPSMLPLFLEHPDAAACSGLRRVPVSGEAVSAALVRQFHERLPGVGLFNQYGPTESGEVTEWACDPGAERVSIGRAIHNSAVYVLDRAGEPVPVGVAGELFIGGVAVARGYLGRAGLTAERFVPDPFGEPGARLYRTGDLCRWLPRGTLEYLGRTDFQVKVRGFRVEPGEIEARLASHPGVREAVVLALDDAAGGKRLVAYFVGEALESEALRAHLSEQLPEYMVPAAFVRLDAFPVTPNGKLDRRALPAPDADAFAARAYEAPLGEMEEALAAIWAELLGTERVGRGDDFFALGGHSLLAVRVISRVRQALGVEAEIRDLFVRPVLADFARGLQTAARTETTAIAPVERSGPLALSFAQQRLWFIEQMEGVGAAYHLPMRLRLRGDLDRGALVRSLDRIVARHEALRTSFPTVDGEPVQHVAPVEESGFRLVEHDLRAAPDAEDELRRLMGDEASAPFDLARGPLFRGRLVRMAADDNVLLLTMHHIVSDGWSMGIFTRELSALYEAFRGGRPDPLPPLPVQYADYAAWQRRWVEGPVLEAQAEYWTETLAGAPELLELPTDHARPARQDFVGASVNVELDEALTAALKTLGQRHGATLFMTLLAGWAAVLARLSGQDDVVIGTPTANRGRAEVEQLIGFFVNTLPLRVDLSGAPTVAGLLDRVRALALEAQRNQDIPFEQVVERVRPARSLAHAPLFQVMFAWQNAPGGILELPELALGPLDPAGSGGSPAQVSAKFDLSLALWEDGGRIVGDVTYATALFDRATVERHVGHLRRVLDGMAADDAKPVHRLDLLSAAERHRVMEEWNATDAAFPAGACVHELFEAQVERTPGAVAVSFERERLTYAELNARANRVAHHLRALGVGPEVRVAVCIKRGIETVVALLAVLKAGGGYVPLDPGHPEDRLRYSLDDSAPGALLTWTPMVPRFADAGVPVVDLGDRAAWGAYPASDPDRAEVGVGPENLAYVIYTSGSTGRPKGVLVQHDSYVNLLAVTRAHFGVGPGDVVSAVASSAFDFSLFELLLPLVCGAEVRLVPPSRVMDARALLSEIADATLVSAVPALMREIVQVERQAPRLARLRATCVAGEAVPADLLAEMSAVFPAARTHVGYGPTETTIFASMHAVPEDGAVTGYPIGKPLGNMRLYVCDALGAPQPVGVVGELLIGGMGVARGYLGRPALTAERFVPDPFSAVPGARLYRSGDRVRWKESGFIDFLGRTDFQVKIRGFRIELGEIEARLREHPAVRQAVVLAREDAPGKKRLVAYVVGEAAAEALKAHLEARLPRYMVPGAYVRLEALPLTSNGKLDRGALPVPDGAAYARRGPEPPRTIAEQVLASIWAELLEVERVDRRDHFFDLGGHSLLAVRMVGRVRESLNPAATVEDVFANPTLYELAARLQGSGEWFGTTHAIPVRETGSERPLFVAHDAVGIVFYGQILRPHLDAEIPIYALPGPLNDTEELESLDDLVTRLVRMMTEVQPEGPYRVAGWSAGGIFAYAVAERLVGTGRAVEFVGLLDTFHPTLAKPDSPRERQFTVLELLARDAGMTPATPEALQALREDAEGMDLPAFVAACKARGLLPETLTVARAEQVYDRIALLKRTHAEYVPGPLPVSVHLFASDESADNPRRGWEDMPGGAPFRLERVPGTHQTMWKKGNVEVVGATISRAIRASAAGGARMGDDAVKREVDYWRETLSGAPSLLELPTDRPRPAARSDRAAVAGALLGAEILDGVRALARREGATPFMVLLAALDVVLSRWSGQDDVVVGTRVAGRTHAGTGPVPGMNTLALRVSLAENPTFRELLGRVRETTLAAHAHQEVPFERVLEEVRPERSPAHAPVFQVMLNLLDFQDGAFRPDGPEAAGAGPGGEAAGEFDLTLYVGERDGGIDINLVYAADLFDAPRMRELLAQLEGVLRQAAAAPETRIGALALATDEARAVLPDPSAPLDATWRGAVHEVFAAQARRTPDALAVEDPRERWTYAELDAATDGVARALADAGVGVGDVVAITGHRSAALARALIGTMKSGAAFLVLDPAYPAARLGDYVRIARPAAHLHLSAAADLPGEVAALLDETIRTRIVLHPRNGRAAEEVDGILSSRSPVSVDVGPDTLAYLSFTSGTTGTPKAVMGRHSSLTHFTPWLAQSFGLGAADRYSLLSGLAHDPLHRDVFTPLQTGAAVVAPLPDEVGTPGYLARWMREAGITVAHLTPAMGQLLADAAEGERIPSLHRAFFVGDVLRRADVARLTALAPALNVVNYYGSTETQRAVSYHEVDEAAEPKEVIPLGRGLPGVQLLVRNASGEIAGIGEVGEIWMRSPHLAAGYLNDPALAAERFLVNPWTGDPRDRLYRTGDLGRYRPDGEVEPLGRADQQVKVRGFRVELGEVESALAAHAAVKEAAVIARETEGGDRRLAAYWVPSDEGADGPDAAALRAHLKALLPEYMVPSAYVRLDRLPLTANGKLDRRALPEPESAAMDSRPAAPRTPTEEILAQIWAEVLRTESFGVDDDFFALGGHSLLATRLLARVQNALGVVLPLRAVFEGPTVAELAVRVEEMRRAGLPVLPPVVPVDRDRPLPLSFAQERLWFLDRLEGGSAAYNLPAALRLTGALDAAALERSLGEIVRRHESLRTVFREVDGGAVQVIAPFAGFALPALDLSGLHETAREREVRRRAREDAARPFDLAEGPLFRAALLRVADEEHVLLLCIHHIVSDGWSTGVLFRELSALYAAYRDGGDSPLAEPPVQYADFAVWQREQLRGEVLDRQIGYWKERLAGAPALLELPTDRPRPPVQSHRGARERFDLPRALLDRLQALGRSEGATLYMVLLGAFQLLLSKYGGSEDIVVGSPIAGRTRREVEELIGFFANTLVLRTDLSADPTFRELLGRVREGTLGAYEHQEVPFERLVAELQPERSLSHSPLFQVMFTLQNADRSGSGLAGLRMAGGVDAEAETTRFDLALTAVPHDGGVHGALEYGTDLFDRSTVRRMLGHLERVLEQVATDADVRLSELELLSAEERGLVVDAWNRTAGEYPADRCIHELFEAQVERTPDAEAVAFEGGRLTYAELNALANRLAHHLRERGVGPDVRVAVCAGRGLEMVVGLLGVLKAGGAYVPLDPSYPAERLRYVLHDSAPAAVLTQRSLDGVEALFAGAEAPVIDLEGAEWVRCPETDPGRAGLTPGHLAYVIYTSGSTGRPKGVAVPHRGVVNLLRSMRETVGMEPADRLLAVTTYAFDISVLEIFLPLLHGARTIVLPRERAADPAALAEAIRAYAPTVMQATPATWRMLVQAGWEGAPEMRALCGGEALPAELASAVRSRVGGLWNVYGPTETTIWSTSEAVRGDSVGVNVPIGRPVANTRVYVLDAALQPVPVGVGGELYIGGAGVVRGYLGRPEQTAERFVADPFGGEPGARLYRTGDLARWRPDGTMEFVGRTDFQVKVRGFRIELGEIEARLTEHAGVREAVVLVREDVPGDVRLVAYVIGDADAESLRAHLSTALPEYMVPAAYVRLEALPLTPNGKLDRRALPAPEGDAYASREYEAPVGKIEVALAEIWTELLRVERVGRRDHFFELGGHSLLALRVVSRVRHDMGLELPLAAVFEKPVLTALAERILELRLARFDPETIARLAQLVREPGAETALAREEPG